MLPAFHAFTGCDNTASFKRKGKVAPFKLLEKSIEVRDVLTEMSTEISLNSSIVERVEKYLCLLYGKETCDSIDDVSGKCSWKNISSSAKKVAKMRQFRK